MNHRRFKLDNKINITEKLLEIVKHRKIQVVVNKQEGSYKRNKKSDHNLAHDNYSVDSDDY
jgi:hypothetical protein